MRTQAVSYICDYDIAPLLFHPGGVLKFKTSADCAIVIAINSLKSDFTELRINRTSQAEDPFHLAKLGSLCTRRAMTCVGMQRWSPELPPDQAQALVHQ